MSTRLMSPHPPVVCLDRIESALAPASREMFGHPSPYCGFVQGRAFKLDYRQFLNGRPMGRIPMGLYGWVEGHVESQGDGAVISFEYPRQKRLRWVLPVIRGLSILLLALGASSTFRSLQLGHTFESWLGLATSLGFAYLVYRILRRPILEDLKQGEHALAEWVASLCDASVRHDPA